MEMEKQPKEVVLDAIALMLSTSATEISKGVWYIGKERATDRVSMVRRIRGVDSANITRLVNALGGDPGSIVDLDGGVMMFTGSTTTVRRIVQVLDEVETQQRPLWVVQLHLVTLSTRDLTDLGLDVSPALDLTVEQATGSLSSGISGVDLNAKLGAVLRASQRSSTVNIVGQPVFLLLDGGTAIFKRQKRIPYRVRTTTQNGNVQDAGVDFIAAGTSVTCTLRELSPSSVLVNLNMEVSELAELTKEALPSIETRNHEAAGALENGGTYLLTSYEMQSGRQTGGNWLSMGFNREHLQEVLQVWARVQAVNGKRIEHTPSEDAQEPIRIEYEKSQSFQPLPNIERETHEENRETISQTN